tara:strand:+ start:2624 stop:3181 length:558 start_codon:yes stop_codon:yes gene_type:complete
MKNIIMDALSKSKTSLKKEVDALTYRLWSRDSAISVCNEKIKGNQGRLDLLLMSIKTNSLCKSHRDLVRYHDELRDLDKNIKNLKGYIRIKPSEEIIIEKERVLKAYEDNPEAYKIFRKDMVLEEKYTNVFKYRHHTILRKSKLTDLKYTAFYKKFVYANTLVEIKNAVDDQMKNWFIDKTNLQN